MTLTPSGLRTTITLDEHGLPSLIEPPGLLPTSIVYDDAGRPRTVSQGARAVTMTYSADGALETVTDATGRTTRVTSRDAASRWLRADVPGPRTIESTRDALGRLTSATGDGDDARFTIDYTISGAIDSVGVPGAARTSFTYDPESFPATLTSPAGTVEWRRDTIGRPERVHLARGDFQLFRDTTGRVVRTTGPDGASYSVDYDGPIATGYHVRGPASAQRSAMTTRVGAYRAWKGASRPPTRTTRSARCSALICLTGAGSATAPIRWEGAPIDPSMAQ